MPLSLFSSAMQPRTRICSLLSLASLGKVNAPPVVTIMPCRLRSIFGFGTQVLMALLTSGWLVGESSGKVAGARAMMALYRCLTLERRPVQVAAMASIGHVIVGVAAARWWRRGPAAPARPLAAAALWTGLSLLPDADVVGFSIGVPYAAPWGHRGATHSFAFALAVGVVVWLAARLAGRRAPGTGLLAAAVVASHPLLDVLTDGGLGCALLWPLSNQRFFAPWTPLPVAPIGTDFLSGRGAHVALVELAFFAPLALYAMWPRPRPVRQSAPRA
jgi:inner membrane protein